MREGSKLAFGTKYREITPFVSESKRECERKTRADEHGCNYRQQWQSSTCL